MNIIDILILAVVATIVGLVMWYIHSSKKKDIQCIGCPDAAKCSGNCSGCTCCGNTEISH